MRIGLDGVRPRTPVPRGGSFHALAVTGLAVSPNPMSEASLLKGTTAAGNHKDPSPPSPEYTLGSHPFLKDLGAKYIRKLAALAQRRTFRPGEYLWRQGDPADLLFLMQSGEVALEISIPHQGPLPFETIVGGELLGWSWLVPPYRYQFDARAVSKVEAFALDGKSVRKSCDEDQELGYQVLKRLTPLIAHRLEMARLRLLEFTRI